MESSQDLNDRLTLEGMLQVVDASSGQTMDVRTILNLKDTDIKDANLRNELSKIENQSVVGNDSKLKDYFS